MKLSEILGPFVGQLVDFHDVGFALYSFIKTATGILYFWNYAQFCESPRVCEPRFIANRGFWIARNGREGLICNVAPNDYSERVVFF